MTNFNENGVVYQCYRDNTSLGIGGYMPEKAVVAKVNLAEALNQYASDDDKHLRVQGFIGSLHHLDAFLLSIERIADYVDLLRRTALSPDPCVEFPRLFIKRSGHAEPINEPPVLVGISSQLLEIDAETALLRAVTVLERLTKLAEQELGLAKVKSFFNLEAELKANPANDVRCKTLLDLLNKVKPSFLRTVLSTDQDTNLRNIIAHRQSSPEIMEQGFTMNFPSIDRLLVFDAELQEFPLIGTIHKIAQAIPFFALEFFKIFLSTFDAQSSLRAWADSQTFQENDFEPTWKNTFIHCSSFIDPEGKGPIFSVIKWRGNRFKNTLSHLREDVFLHSAPTTKISIADSDPATPS
jgi:hypothetical protein